MNDWKVVLGYQKLRQFVEYTLEKACLKRIFDICASKKLCRNHLQYRKFLEFPWAKWKTLSSVIYRNSLVSSFFSPRKLQRNLKIILFSLSCISLNSCKNYVAIGKTQCLLRITIIRRTRNMVKLWTPWKSGVVSLNIFKTHINYYWKRK